MKKIIVSVVLAMLSVFVFTGCQQKESEKETGETTAASVESIDMNIAGLKGPTSIGMVQLMEADEAGSTANNYNFTIAGSADEITPKLIQGEFTIAAIPANLASVLYNNTEGGIQLLAINTLGVNYIVENGNTLTSIEDLRGKKIYATGKGSTPEYALRYLLSENGIDPDTDVTIEWKSEPTEVVALLSQETNAIAMLPQPYVTVAQSKIASLRIAIDFTKEWENLDNGSMLITGVIVVRSDFAKEYPQQIAAFLEEYEESTKYVNANVEQAAQLVEKFGIVSASVAKQAIPYCNITYIEGEDMKNAMEGYLNVLYEQNKESVGGELPDDAFYYEK